MLQPMPSNPGAGQARPSGPRKGSPTVKLADLKHGVEAHCFLKLVKKESRTSAGGDSFFRCEFKDETAQRTSMVWSSSPVFEQANLWQTGLVYLIRARGEVSIKFGPQFVIEETRQATDADSAHGYALENFVEKSLLSLDELWSSLNEQINRGITNPKLKQLVMLVLEENRELLNRMPAAQSYHHAYLAGLLEHIRSMARISGFLGEHYAHYYKNLNPPLNKSLIVAAAVLHDIGKLRELEFRNLDVHYSLEGSMIGHIVIGRDLVREAASRIEDFPQDELMLLEHAILAHHGKREFGSPVVPQTLEALILHYIDDLDSKVNIVAMQLMRTSKDEDFTDKVHALEGRKFYTARSAAPKSNAKTDD